MSEKLIDYLAEKSGLYVSDLPAKENNAVIARIVSEINPEDFSTQDWNSSLSYLFGSQIQFENQMDAKAYYIKVLQK